MSAVFFEPAGPPLGLIVEVDPRDKLGICGKLYAQVAGDSGRHRKVTDEDVRFAMLSSEDVFDNGRCFIQRERHADAHFVVRSDVAAAELVSGDRYQAAARRDAYGVQTRRW